MSAPSPAATITVSFDDDALGAADALLALLGFATSSRPDSDAGEPERPNTGKELLA